MTMEHGLTSYSNARYNPSYQGWTRQPSKRKKVPNPGKRVRDIHSHSQCRETHKNIKLHNHNIYAEDLAQTHTGPFFFLFSLCEFLWVPLSWFYGPCSPGILHTSDSYNPSSSSSMGSLSSAQCLAVSLCICSHLLLSEASLMMIVLSTKLWV